MKLFYVLSILTNYFNFYNNFGMMICFLFYFIDVEMRFWEMYFFMGFWLVRGRVGEFREFVF